MSDNNIAHEILIEYSIDDLQELAQSRGIDTDHKTRGSLIRELLNLEEGYIAFAFTSVYHALLLV